MLCGFAGKAFKNPCPASMVFFSKESNVMKHPGFLKILVSLLVFFILGGQCLAEEEKPASVQPPAAQSQQAAPHAEGLSKFEEYVRGISPGAVSDIRQFGYGLFDEPPSTFAPVETVPVGSDYVLGPGDELRVSLWGKVSADLAAIIDRDGKITIPQMGVLHLSGMNFTEANAFLLKELSKYYLPAEVKLNVSMGRLRAIRVFVVGKARRPGSYSISSLSTLVNALFAAGGPSKSGSMRNIEVKRAGKTITSFDMYDFLLKGDKTKDVRLMPEDVLFIPPAGPLAGIAGNVMTPAIYELKGESSVRDIIQMAGGLNDIAFKDRVQIERVMENSRQTVFESNIADVRPEDIKIQGGDLISIFTVVPDRKVARISGAVRRSGDYGIGASFTVKELLKMAGGLMPFAYTKEAELTRVLPTQDGPVTTKVIISIEKALEGDPNHNIELKENDYLFVRAVPEWEIYRTVTISGEVKFPGQYTVKKGETLSSLIVRAGGFTDKAYLKGAAFTRESVKALQQTQLDEAIDRLEQEMISQSAESVAAALSAEEAALQQAASAQRKSLVAKLRAAKAKGRIAINLASIDKFMGTGSDLELEEGDGLFVPAVHAEVHVIGSVYNQTAFIYSPENNVSDYIRKAGGLTKDADDGELYVLKVDGSSISKREAGILFGRFGSLGLDPGDTIVAPAEIEKVVWLREVKEITQILYQIAVTAGVLIVAF